MSVEDTLDALDELLDDAFNVPLGGGRCVVNAEDIRDLLDQIRDDLSDGFSDMRQARSVLAKREEIYEAAKQEGKKIIHRAEEQAKALVAKEEIVRAANTQAQKILAQAQTRSREIRQVSLDYASHALVESEESLMKTLKDVQETRRALQNSGKKTVTVPNVAKGDGKNGEQ